MRRWTQIGQRWYCQFCKVWQAELCYTSPWARFFRGKDQSGTRIRADTRAFCSFYQYLADLLLSFFLIIMWVSDLISGFKTKIRHTNFLDIRTLDSHVVDIWTVSLYAVFFICIFLNKCCIAKLTVECRNIFRIFMVAWYRIFIYDVV